MEKKLIESYWMDFLTLVLTHNTHHPAVKIGLKHPDAVVESASLSSVEAPDVDYQLAIPVECIEDGMLSAVQLETVTYACQKHQNELPNGDRVGFLIGDGAGVGKGRTIAGIIYENFLRGRRRSLWSVVTLSIYCVYFILTMDLYLPYLNTLWCGSQWLEAWSEVLIQVECVKWLEGGCREGPWGHWCLYDPCLLSQQGSCYFECLPLFQILC